MSVFVPYRNARGAIHSLEYAGGLSPERTIPLLVSPRVLYVLQNLANLDIGLECRYAVSLADGGYNRLTTDDAEYSDFLNLVSDVALQLRERRPMWETGDFREVAHGNLDPGDYPYAWLLCNGEEASRSDYADLFAVIGTIWGAGDGSTTFNVPNLLGRSLQMLEAGDAVGDLVGTKTQTLVPQHDHDILGRLTSGGAATRFFNASAGSFFTGTTEAFGEASGVDQRGPRAVVAIWIKT